MGQIPRKASKRRKNACTSRKVTGSISGKGVSALHNLINHIVSTPKIIFLLHFRKNALEMNLDIKQWVKKCIEKYRQANSEIAISKTFGHGIRFVPC